MHIYIQPIYSTIRGDTPIYLSGVYAGRQAGRQNRQNRQNKLNRLKRQDKMVGLERLGLSKSNDII